MLFMPEILALGKLRQEDHKFKDSVGYIEGPYLKKQQKRDTFENPLSIVTQLAERWWPCL